MVRKINSINLAGELVGEASVCNELTIRRIYRKLLILTIVSIQEPEKQNTGLRTFLNITLKYLKVKYDCFEEKDFEKVIDKAIVVTSILEKFCLRYKPSPYKPK